MDGVLVDSHAAHRRAWRVFLETLHRQVQDSELDYILDGRKRIDILRHFLGDLPVADLDEFGRRKDTIFRQIQLAVCPVPGVVRLVRELRQGGARLAVATSASRSRAGSTLAELGLLDCFETVVTGEEAARGKPDPAIYRLASERLGIAPRDLLAVEDAVSGVQAAVAAGLACVALCLHKSPEALRAAGAACVISGFENVSWNDLEGVLLALPPMLTDARGASNAV
jgi:HAD superfamily hydrolase (TIGR01509 family)